jgi:hypothetical protein
MSQRSSRDPSRPGLDRDPGGDGNSSSIGRAYLSAVRANKIAAVQRADDEQRSLITRIATLSTC